MQKATNKIDEAALERALTVLDVATADAVNEAPGDVPELPELPEAGEEHVALVYGR